MGDRLATIHIGRKWRGCRAPFHWGAASPSNAMWPGWGLPPYEVSSWSIQPFGHNRHGPKIGAGLCTVFLGRDGSTSNTILLGPRPTSVPSGILIHPTVCLKQTWGENWGLCHFFWGQLGPHLTQCHFGHGQPPYQMASWSIQPFGHCSSLSQTLYNARSYPSQRESKLDHHCASPSS